MANWRDMQDTMEPESRGPLLQIQPKTQSGAEAVYAQINGPDDVEEISEEIQLLTEVESRLRKANYYRIILDQDLFEGQASEEALEVELEFRQFAYKKLTTLLGMQAEETSRSTFTPNEEIALKALAAKVLAAEPSLARQELPPPTLKKVQMAPPKPPPLVQPQLKKLTDPTALAAPQKRKVAKSTPKPQKQPQAAPEVAAAPSKPPQFLEVEVKGADGKMAKVQMNTQGQVRPTGIQPAPAPNPELLFAMEMARADQAEQSNPILRQIQSITGE